MSGLVSFSQLFPLDDGITRQMVKVGFKLTDPGELQITTSHRKNQIAK